MKKCLSLLLILAMLIPTLAACGKDEPDETDPDTGTETPAETDAGTPAEISDTVELVKDGVSEYVIVRGENATEDEIKASTELQSYLKQISGAELPIVTDATPAAAKEIVIGLTNREKEGQFDRAELEYDGFIIKTEAGKLWLVGGTYKGPLYAVYELLESYLDCRFFTATLEKVPEQKTISLSIEEDKQIPMFDIRYSTGTGVAGALMDKYKWYYPVWAGGRCHTLPELGEVGSGSSSSDPDPCLQSEEAFQTVLKNVRARLEATPNAQYISVSQTDATSGGGCPCEKCVAYEAENGVSANYIQFVNRIAEEIKDEYPNVLIHTFAYKNTVEPPKNDIKVADNVMVQICTHNSCFSHPLAECAVEGHANCSTMDEFFAEPTQFCDIEAALEGWSKICDNIAIWDYYDNFELYPLDMPCLDVMWENYQLFAKYDVDYFFAEGPYNTPNVNFNALKVYLIAQLLWEPNMGEEKYYAYMDEFLEAYYGPGWKHIRTHIDNMEAETDNVHFSYWIKPWEFMQLTFDETNKNRKIPELDADTLRNYKDVDWSQYNNYFVAPKMNDILEVGLECFAAARAEAETEEQLYRLESSIIHLETMNAYYQMTVYGKCTSKALPKIYEGNLKARVADGSMTQEEADSLKAAFKADIMNPIKESVALDNLLKPLAQKCIDFGCTMLRPTDYMQEYINGEKGFWQ